MNNPQYMKVATQLNIRMPNIPGSLAKVCDCLRAADVNIEAMFCDQGDPTSSVHLIVDDNETAKMALGQFAEVSSTKVLSFLLKNKPGAVAQIARMCAGAGLNISNIYATTHGKEATVYVLVDDFDKALTIFGNAAEQKNTERQTSLKKLRLIPVL